MKLGHFFFFTFILITAVTFTSCKKQASSSQSEASIQKTGNPTVDNFSKEIRKNPNDSELYYQRAVAFANMEAFDNAILDMQSAIKIDSLQPKYYVHLADVFVNYYRSKQAVKTLRIASQLFPSNIPLLLKYSELLITLNQNQQAVQALNNVLEQDNENADAFFLMGLIMQTEGDVKRAQAAFKKVVEIDPEITDAYILLGELYEKEDPKLALQYLENAITVAPNNVNALHSKAFFLQNNKQILQALEIYRQINIVDPNYAPAFLNAGILYLEEYKFEEAYEQFNILVGINPTNHLGYYYRGLVFAAQKQNDKAKADFEQALVYKPDFKKANDELVRMKQ